MSKTLKTRPLHVRILDPKDHAAGIEEHHNHEKGFCDLPERNAKAIEERYEALRSGEYPFKNSETCRYDFSYTGVGICGCILCTGQPWRKQSTRNTRHAAKETLAKETREIKAALRESNSLDEEALEDFDTPWVAQKAAY
jgi:hypothetical protein